MSKQKPFGEWSILTPEDVSRIQARKQTAVRVAQGTPGTRTNHLQLFIDFHITVAGESPDDDGLNEPDPVYHARQARLLAAVKSNSPVLKQWMNNLVAGQMYQRNWHEWDMLPGGEISSQDMLVPVLAALLEYDQAYFAEVAQGGSLDDMIEHFSASFTIAEDKPVIREQGDEA